MRRCVLIALTVTALCSTALAAGPVLTEQDKQTLQSVGIAPDDKMVSGLDDTDSQRFAQIIRDKPASDLKAFLVTRYVVRRVNEISDASQKDPKVALDSAFTPAEIETIRQNFDYNFCRDDVEKLTVFNYFSLIVNIQPVRTKTPF